MTIFTSQPTHITFDVEEYGAVELTCDELVNPILVALRNDAAEYGVSLRDEADIYLGYAESDFDGIVTATPEHIEHARRVLARLESINRQEV